MTTPCTHCGHPKSAHVGGSCMRQHQSLCNCPRYRTSNVLSLVEATSPADLGTLNYFGNTTEVAFPFGTVSATSRATVLFVDPFGNAHEMTTAQADAVFKAFMTASLAASTWAEHLSGTNVARATVAEGVPSLTLHKRTWRMRKSTLRDPKPDARGHVRNWNRQCGICNKPTTDPFLWVEIEPIGEKWDWEHAPRTCAGCMRAAILRGANGLREVETREVKHG